MRRVVFCVCIGAIPLLMTHCKGEEAESTIRAKNEIVCRAEDGVETRGILYTTHAPHPAGIVLVHAAGSSPGSWEPFARRAQELGFMCLALSMRGHDRETPMPGSYREFDQAGWMAVLKDIDAAVQVLKEQGADAENIAVAGASIGANLALHYGLAHKDAEAIVMVSPGLDFNGVKTEKAVVELGKRPVLLVTTKGDAYSASSCARLKAVASGFCELREYEGSAHGTDIFVTSPNSIEQVLLWLEGIIGPPKSA